MANHVESCHPTKKFKCLVCGKVKLIFEYPTIYEYIHQLTNQIKEYLICKDIQYRSLSAKTRQCYTRQLFTRKKTQSSVHSVASLLAGIIQEICVLISYKGKTICLVTLMKPTVAVSKR